MGKNQARYGSGSGMGRKQPDEFAKRSDDTAVVHVKGRGQKTLTPKAHVHNSQKNDYRTAVHAGKRRTNPMMGATRICKGVNVRQKSVVEAFSAGRDANSQTGKYIKQAGVKLPGRLAFKFGQHSNAITGTALAGGAAEELRRRHKGKVAKAVGHIEAPKKTKPWNVRGPQRPLYDSTGGAFTKGDFAIPASQISQGGAAGVKALKSTGREIETSLWKKVGAKPRVVNLNRQPVTKGIPTSWLGHLSEDFKAGRGAAKASTSMFPVKGPSSTAGKVGEFTVKKPKQTAGIALAATGVTGVGMGRASKRDVSKRDRFYDPETNRQNRQGTYQGAGAVAGAYGVGSGIKGIVRDNKGAAFNFDSDAMGIRRKLSSGPNKGEWSKTAVALNEHEKSELERLTGRRGKLIRGKQAGKIGLGLGALGTAAAFRQHSLSERNRAYN